MKRRGLESEAGGEEGVVDGAGVVEEELGFDAADAGGVVEKLKELMEELLGDLKNLCVVAADGEGVADYGFLAFVDAEGEAADASTVESDETGEDAGVEVLEEKLGGTLVVPAKALLPDARLGFEQRTELTSGEVTKVQYLELGGDGHTLWWCVRLSLSEVCEEGVREEVGEYRIVYCFCEDPIDLESLWFVEEERLVEAIGEAAVEFCCACWLR